MPDRRSWGIDLADVALWLGVGAIAMGLWAVWWPGALFAVGVVLVWVGLPPRPPFFLR